MYPEPAVLPHVPGSEVAGEIVGKMLRRFNTVELACCLVMLSVVGSAFRFGFPARETALLISALVLMGILTVTYAYRITPRMEAIKEATPGFYDLSKDHLMRKEFNRLHRSYVRLMSVNLILGLAVLYGSAVTF
jgi:hypothetical protein